MRVAFIAGALLVCLPLGGCDKSERWVLVDKGSRIPSYLDTETIEEHSPNDIQYWLKTDTSRDKSSVASSVTTRFSIDCEERTGKRLYGVAYGQDGQPEASINFEEHGEIASPIIPGTVGQAVFERLCG